MDRFGKRVELDDFVLIAIRSGKGADLTTGIVKSIEFRPQFRGGVSTNMVLVEWSNIHKYWMPASKVVVLPDSMIPEKLQEKLDATKEGVIVS